MDAATLGYPPRQSRQRWRNSKTGAAVKAVDNAIAAADLQVMAVRGAPLLEKFERAEVTFMGSRTGTACKAVEVKVVAVPVPGRCGNVSGRRIYRDAFHLGSIAVVFL